jgi:hypothetical protein
MLYPDSFSTEQDSFEGSLLRKARDNYGIKLVPVQVQSREGVECKFPFYNTSESAAIINLPSFAVLRLALEETNHGSVTWKESYTKHLAFNQAQYKRVLHLDSDATILQVIFQSP